MNKDTASPAESVRCLTQREMQAALDSVRQPVIEQETALSLERNGYLVYDANLTGHPVSGTSTLYPDSAFGYMDDDVVLGYQAALLSMHNQPRCWRRKRVQDLRPRPAYSAGACELSVCPTHCRCTVTRFSS